VTKTFIAPFRGINVGGNAILPMNDLVRILESLDLRDVKTYTQSGNVVSRSTKGNPPRISVRIRAEIRKCFGLNLRCCSWSQP
jgi:uncharacterized protein (DUF1697 family)